MAGSKAAFVAALLGATALLSPMAAQAQRRAGPSAREAALEARLAKMEAELAELRTALQASRAQTDAEGAASAARAAQLAEAAQAAVTRSEATAAKLAALEAKPAPEGMRSGNTTIKLTGFVKLVAASSHFANGAVATNSLGRDFYLLQTIPVGTAKGTTDTDFGAKQTRIAVNLASTVAGHRVLGYVETDFQVDSNAAPAITGGGSQRTTNGYTLALRRAWLQVDRLLIGQEWTNFQYVGALPESTDYVGATEGTVFARQPQIRYTAPLSTAATLSVAMENPESATATLGAPALVENGTDHLPDATARLNLAGKLGELLLAGLVRQVRVEASGTGRTQTGYGVSAAGKLWLNTAKSADLRAMVTYGRDISRYVGLNFAPDAVLVPATGRLEHVKVLAGLVAVRVPLAAQWRTNLIGSFQQVDYASALPLASIAAYNKRAFSIAGNLFYSPVKNVDLGIEVRHGERELVSGQKGRLDRVEFAAKYGF